MEDNDKLNKFLSEKMSVDNLDLSPLNRSFVSVARNKVLARKKTTSEIEDLFSMIAAFLNFKIKLYHAVITAVITGGIILFATKNDYGTREESHTSDYVSNIASVRSSTVLSGIYTLGLSKTQYDGSTNN